MSIIVDALTAEAWKAYYFQPQGAIDKAAFVPRGMHRISALDNSETGTEMFQVVGSKRWHRFDMFIVRDMNATW